MRVTVLTGGVGGAKFVEGLAHCGEDLELTAIVNTGDDFRHLGLHVSPDIDTLLYTLAGLADRAQGWGRADETWNFMTALSALGGPEWFRLGDADLALHALRTERLAQGMPLSAVVDEIAAHWGIPVRVLPMSDEPVATWLDTDEGALAFQTYFVARQCRPTVRAVRFEGAARARPAPGVTEALGGAGAILIAPSNPWLSVDPILAVPGIADALRAARAPVIAISPLIGGRAVKGPTGKLIAELGLAPDNATIAAHYAGLLDGLVHDLADAPPPGLPARATATLMTSIDDKRRVALAALAFARELAR
ncbi:MAG: 2-phospho-L-lactate transferase [Novosphingobium sp.]